MPEPVSTLLILGAGGDLSKRLLLPALGQLLTLEPDRRVQLVGAGMDHLEANVWRARIAESFGSVDVPGTEEAPGDSAAARLVMTTSRYMQADVTDPHALQQVLDACDGTPAIYFALPPAVTARACKALESVSFPPSTVLALEKPFGTDEEGAAALNAQLLQLVPEEQIHRVDHFLGRSTVYNLLGFRFANRIFEPVWSREHIEKIEIVYDEQLGLEGRAGYYDRAGALVDMIQSHLLQVLSVLAMEPPATLDAADLRDAKGLVLRATHVFDFDPSTFSHRARYTAGAVHGRDLPSYVDEPGVDASRKTETLAQVTFGIDTWRWAGVPFTLRSGKALVDRRREIVVTFKEVPHLPAGLRGHAESTVLRILLAPDEMSLELNVNGPGDPHELERVSLHADFGPGQLLAYGEVLSGILDGDPALSVRGDTAEQCWRIVQPVLEAWAADEVPLDEYEAGSTGPAGWGDGSVN